MCSATSNVNGASPVFTTSNASSSASPAITASRADERVRKQAQGLGIRRELQHGANPPRVECVDADQAPVPRAREPVRREVAAARVRTEPGKADRDPAAQRLADLEQRRVADPQPVAIAARREPEHLRAVERNRAGRRGRRQLDDLEPVANGPLPFDLARRAHCGVFCLRRALQAARPLSLTLSPLRGVRGPNAPSGVRGVLEQPEPRQALGGGDERLLARPRRPAENAPRLVAGRVLPCRARARLCAPRAAAPAPAPSSWGARASGHASARAPSRDFRTSAMSARRRSHRRRRGSARPSPPGAMARRCRSATSRTSTTPKRGAASPGPRRRASAHDEDRAGIVGPEHRAEHADRVHHDSSSAPPSPGAMKSHAARSANVFDFTYGTRGARVRPARLVEGRGGGWWP